MKEEREAIKILKELVRCGEFYYSAIEINLMTPNCTDGEQFEKKIKELLSRACE